MKNPLGEIKKECGVNAAGEGGGGGLVTLEMGRQRILHGPSLTPMVADEAE